MEQSIAFEEEAEKLSMVLRYIRQRAGELKNKMPAIAAYQPTVEEALGTSPNRRPPTTGLQRRF